MRVKKTTNPAATEERVEKLLSYLELAQFEGDTLGCISPSYTEYLEMVIKHVKLRLARGEFSK